MMIPAHKLGEMDEIEGEHANGHLGSLKPVHNNDGKD